MQGSTGFIASNFMCLRNRIYEIQHSKLLIGIKETLEWNSNHPLSRGTGHSHGEIEKV